MIYYTECCAPPGALHLAKSEDEMLCKASRSFWNSSSVEASRRCSLCSPTDSGFGRYGVPPLPKSTDFHMWVRSRFFTEFPLPPEGLREPGLPSACDLPTLLYCEGCRRGKHTWASPAEPASRVVWVSLLSGNFKLCCWEPENMAKRRRKECIQRWAVSLAASLWLGRQEFGFTPAARAWIWPLVPRKRFDSFTRWCLQHHEFMPVLSIHLITFFLNLLYLPFPYNTLHHLFSMRERKEKQKEAEEEEECLASTQKKKSLPTKLRHDAFLS